MSTTENINILYPQNTKSDVLLVDVRTNDIGRIYNGHYYTTDVYTDSEMTTPIENSSNGFNVDNIWNIRDIVEKLGSSVTPEQTANIANGSFNGLYIGAYWTIDGTNYRIMAHDQFYGYNGIDKHHVVVMPDSIYTTQKYNNSDINSGGYLSSALKNYIINTYNPMITNAFGSNHVLSHTHDLTSGDYRNGTLTATANTKAWLINGFNMDVNHFQYETNYVWQTADRTLFPAFRYNSSLKISKYNGSAHYWWLGSSSSDSSSTFCSMGSSGTVYDYYASDSRGVRPAFLVY